MRYRILAITVLAFTVLSIAHAQTYTYSSIYTFKFSGSGPKAPIALIIDPAGNLYGTSYYGGQHSSGTVFELTPQGAITVLHDFTPGAASPTSLARDAEGNLYGTTLYNARVSGSIVFKLTAERNGAYGFSNLDTSTDEVEEVAVDPAGDVVGFFCGQTKGGGFCDPASLFGIPEGGAYTTLWNFSTGVYNGSNLVLDPSGNIYGAVAGDGGISSFGYVYEWSPVSGYSILHTFSGSDGSSPDALQRDEAGNLYGTTYSGGRHNGAGTVFKISPTTGFSTIYNFCSLPNCVDGALPQNLVLDSAGNIYGPTYSVVFRITPGGAESVIYNSGGLALSNSLVIDQSGNLYGFDRRGEGSVYKLTVTK